MVIAVLLTLGSTVLRSVRKCDKSVESTNASRAPRVQEISTPEAFIPRTSWEGKIIIVMLEKTKLGEICVYHATMQY